MLGLLEITAEKDGGVSILNQYGFGETALFGLQVLLLGMAIVFAVLIIIWVALIAFKFVFHDLKSTSVKKDKVAPVKIDEPVVYPVANADDEIVAVIAAAIAMAESESPSGLKFRVVSFKRK